MEAMVDDQGTVVVSQSGSIDSAVSSSQRNSGATHQVVTTASGQTIAVPTLGGAVSIVHLALPNQQPMSVQSVIQQNQQSVIQTTSHAASHLQAVQLPKGGVILLNKNTGSVIQPTSGGHLQTIQVASLSEAEEMAVAAEEESKKRREILARRPSYRKILNDLSSADSPAISSDVKEESSMSESSNDGNDTMNTITVAGISDGSLKGDQQEYIVVPAGAIQMATGSQGETIQGLQTLTMTNAGGGAAGTIVQYAQGQDGQFFVPVTVSAADLQAYQIRASGGNGNQGVVVTPTTNLHSPQQIAEEASRKRELRLLKNRSRTQSRVQPDSCYNAENGSNSQVNIRLLKNREAARECRRKKKEYIKCLENRVAVLENQNKALIEELKSLKELYCQKND